MIAFWAATGLLAAVAAVLVLLRAARAATAVGSEDPTLAVYRRQLAEIDDLAQRGLIGEEEQRTAHAEAGRRLLSAADHAAADWSQNPKDRRIALAVAAMAPIAALVLYMVIGSPGLADAPLHKRLTAWRNADLQTLPPQVTKERPNDPEAFRYLALAEGAAENPSQAGRALRHAITLAPQRADLWELLGQSLVSENGGQPSPEADNAFREALKRDPKAISARFHLARSKVIAGDKAGGIADWRARRPGRDPGHGRGAG
jgi:cytochrome c-type biogenesis protein CcmH